MPDASPFNAIISHTNLPFAPMRLGQAMPMPLPEPVPLLAPIPCAQFSLATVATNSSLLGINHPVRNSGAVVTSDGSSRAMFEINTSLALNASGGHSLQLAVSPTSDSYATLLSLALPPAETCAPR